MRVYCAVYHDMRTKQTAESHNYLQSWTKLLIKLNFRTLSLVNKQTTMYI